ncbi:AI-2E family transporter [uncultured Eudoraea sp.]|uniref:AI-2E family transporter n=1 Tax=uncultured Eudoraea sp. TaxID=1035614 RepID=UPI0026374DCD|nr:AI-2E family transporter [uncultured Eudoraea sp.]
MNTKDNMTSVLRIVVLLLILVWCFLIIRPFVIIAIWSILLAVALYPLYKWFVAKVGDHRKKFATFIFTFISLLLLAVPAYFVLASIFESIATIVDQIKSEGFQIPSPDLKIKSWPLVGERLYDEWYALSDNIEQYAVVHKDTILEFGKDFLSSVKGFLGTMITFIISFFISLVLMFNAENAYRASLRLFMKLIGQEGEEVILISRDTIRNVIKGILLVAVIQSVLAFIGFKAIGIAGAGIFTLLVLIAAIVQIPVTLVMVVPILFAFSIAEPTYAIIFTIYCLLVGLSDNVLKPILLGKGLKTPMIVILIGTIGGLLLHGIIGLFVGPVILSVVYQLYQYWISKEV